MKVLMVNKFLYPNGGSETYIFKLGEELIRQGHKVQYFGMEHEGRCVGNSVNTYTSKMDFHKGSRLSKLLYPVKTIYSIEARKKIRLVLEDFKPDVIHLNNFNYQITPSVIVEVIRWKKKAGHKCKIIYTAHDYQLICPNHMMYNPNTHTNCQKCLGSRFLNCTNGNCIHGSKVKSFIGTMEACYWNKRNIYEQIDIIICPSRFMKKQMDTNPVFRKKTIILHNFIGKPVLKDIEKRDYILYFGRFSEEKGMKTLIQACRELPSIQFVFAGTGPFGKELEGISNIKNVGFQKGPNLDKLISEAQLSVYPSEWYENCPFSVMESQMCGTPVLGADIGGIPELIKAGYTGDLFESGNKEEFVKCIKRLWNNRDILKEYSINCNKIEFDTLESYTKKLIDLY